MRRIGRWLVVAAAVLALGAVGIVVWGSTPAGPMPEAQAALASDGRVQVETQPWLVFTPAGAAPTTGLVLYPGGRVDPRAYAPAARAIAARGYRVVIVPMPLNLAVLAPDRAAEVIAAYPEIHHWAVGGHSLGGAMAAHFARAHPGAVEALLLWASYPAASDDLSQRRLAVTSVSASLDGLATPEKIAASRPWLPPGTRWVSVAGGDHAQFGWYGPQSGDHPADISREDQQAQIVAASLDLLAGLEAGGLPRASLTVLNACGHLPQEDCPEAFLAAVEAVIRRLPGATLGET